MPTITAGNSQTITLGAADAYTVTIAAGGEAYVDLLSGAPGSPSASFRLAGPTASRTFGPYGVAARIRVRVAGGSADFGAPAKELPAAELTTADIPRLRAQSGLARLISSALKPADQDNTMASLPTITISAAGAGTAISGGALVAWDDARLTYSTRVAAKGAVSPDSTLARPDYLDTAADGAAATMRGLLTGFSFATSATAFELRGKGFSKHRVWVIESDGVPRALPIQTMPGTGDVYRTLYDFGGARKTRQIYVQFTSDVGGVVVGPTENIIQWSPLTAKLLICGDSNSEGTGAASVFSGYGVRLAEHLGCLTSLILCGIGGTGYVATNGGTKKNALGIVQSSVIANAPDVVVWAHGLNDSADVSANAAACFDAVAAALPDCKQIVFMPFQPRSIPGVSATLTQLLAVCATRPNITVIDLTTYGTTPEVTGTGRVGATTGSGNSDWWTGSDGTHPTNDGHAHSAVYRDAAIRLALGLA